MPENMRRDGEAGAGYLELVDLLQSRGANTLADCEQLFRRVLLNVRIPNTDDHLRNHGFFVDAYLSRAAGIRAYLSDQAESCRDVWLNSREAASYLCAVRERLVLQRRVSKH